MQKMLNFLNKNKYWIFVIILYVLLFIQMQNVYMYADDYGVVFKIDSFKTYIDVITEEMKNYFNNWSGRLIGHFTVISGLSIFGMNFFRFLNPIMVFIICLFISKIIKFKLNISLSKLIFWLTISILGIEFFITRECLYWADGTILYLWGYVPLIINIYIILKAFYKDKKLTIFEFIICILLCTIINFTMESTQVFNLIFLFLLIIFNYKRYIKNKKVLFIFIYTTTIFILSFFIPGNLARFHNSSFIEQSFVSTVVQRLYLFVNKILACRFNHYLFIISNIMILKTNYQKLKNEKIFFYLLVLLNIINGLNILFGFATENNFNIVFLVIYMLYVMMIIIVGYINLKNEKILMNAFTSSIFTSLFSVLLASYWCTRFYLIYLIVNIVFIIYFCMCSNEKEKIVILLSIIYCLDIRVFILLIVLMLLKRIGDLQKLNIKYICLTIIILVFSNRFLWTIYYYHQNVSTFKYNNYILENKITDNGIIYLKKLPYNDYKFQLPYDFDYVTFWFYRYHNLFGYQVIWED